MNIFVTSPLPSVSAGVLDDRRLVNMVLETAQLLSGAVRCQLPDVPSARWTRAEPPDWRYHDEECE